VTAKDVKNGKVYLKSAADAAKEEEVLGLLDLLRVVASSRCFLSLSLLVLLPLNTRFLSFPSVSHY
jgi:hypothetical protein